MSRARNLNSIPARRAHARNLIVGILAVIFVKGFLACETSPKLPYYTSAEFTPVWSKQEGVKHVIQPFSLTDQDGKKVTEKTFAGHIYVANFFFVSCPGICPRMSGNLKTLQEVFRDDPDVLFLSHSVTPEMDSVPMLKGYAARHEVISGKWHLVTGDRAAIYGLARHSYFADESKNVPENTGDFLHTEKMFLVDKTGHLRGVYNGVLPAEMERIKEDIRLLKTEG
jgi:protein SCO1/2